MVSDWGEIVNINRELSLWKEAQFPILTKSTKRSFVQSSAWYSWTWSVVTK